MRLAANDGPKQRLAAIGVRLLDDLAVAWLGDKKRTAAKRTIDAYTDSVERFIDFVALGVGCRPTLVHFTRAQTPGSVCGGDGDLGRPHGVDDLDVTFRTRDGVAPLRTLLDTGPGCYSDIRRAWPARGFSPTTEKTDCATLSVPVCRRGRSNPRAPCSSFRPPSRVKSRAAGVEGRSSSRSGRRQRWVWLALTEVTNERQTSVTSEGTVHSRQNRPHTSEHGGGGPSASRRRPSLGRLISGLSPLARLLLCQVSCQPPSSTEVLLAICSTRSFGRVCPSSSTNSRQRVAACRVSCFGSSSASWRAAMSLTASRGCIATTATTTGWSRSAARAAPFAPLVVGAVWRSGPPTRSITSFRPLVSDSGF